MINVNITIVFTIVNVVIAVIITTNVILMRFKNTDDNDIKQSFIHVTINHSQILLH